MASENMGYVGDAFIGFYFILYIYIQYMWTICSHYKLLLYGKEENLIFPFVECFWVNYNFNAQRLLLLIKSPGQPWSSYGCDRITNTKH